MARQPNIIFMLTDDLGYKDLGCYGSTFYETPHLDALARRGTRFTNAYAACPVCSPTRASLLTGQYPATVGITDWIDWHGRCHPARGRVVDVPYLKELPTTNRTVAKAMRDGGYATWHVGKWHLGGPGHLPTEHGFDVNVGGCEWGCPIKGYFSPWGVPGLPDGEPGEYLDTHLTEKACELIANHDSSKQPFYLNMCFYLVHTPLQAPKELVAKYEAKAKRLRLDTVNPLEEGDFHPSEMKKNQRIQRRRFQSHPTYAAMMELLDDNVGRLVAAVEAAGELDNTIFVFTSDNGGLSTSEGSPTCNYPLIEGKGWMYEGGTREPYIVAWPGVTAPGSLIDEPITSPDWFPTALAMAGLDAEPEAHVDGVSFAPALRGEDFERGAIFWHYPHYGNQGGTPGSSVRLGDWVLIEFHEDGHRELYDLATDISQVHEVSAANPTVVENLATLLDAWRVSVQAKMPQPNPDFVPWQDRDLKPATA